MSASVTMSETSEMPEMNADELWMQFMDGEDMTSLIQPDVVEEETKVGAEMSELSISTKTMISYLNQPVNIRNLFWELPLIHYHELRQGILKKQIKWTCTTEEEIEQINELIEQNTPNREGHPFLVETLKQSNTGKFKDVRKLNMGMCKKDILSYRTKKKSAFYNCIVVILRIEVRPSFYKEIHVKLFNTGKMEIPGIQEDRILFKTLDVLCYLLNQTTYLTNVRYTNREEDVETVLINSNFHCGYTVNRQKLYQRLKFTYGFNALYDPCKYPGVQCKFYYKRGIPQEKQDGICHCDTPCSKKGRPRNAPTGPCMELSFMVFRTGSILIVGHCHERILREIHATIVNIMHAERDHCMIRSMTIAQLNKHVPVRRNRKFHVSLSKETFEQVEASRACCSSHSPTRQTYYKGLCHGSSSIAIPSQMSPMTMTYPISMSISTELGSITRDTDHTTHAT